MGHNRKAISRITLVAAGEVLESHTQATFNKMVFRLGLENDIPADYDVSVAKKCVELAKIVVRRSAEPLETLEGESSLGETYVHEAVAVVRKDSPWEPQQRFERALERDGYSLTWNQDEKAVLRPSLPVECCTKIDDELRHLLEARGFITVCGHLDQALNAHMRGDWAASNGQLRAFMEGLFDDIADLLRPDATAGLTSENRRVLFWERLASFP